MKTISNICSNPNCTNVNVPNFLFDSEKKLCKSCAYKKEIDQKFNDKGKRRLFGLSQKSTIVKTIIFFLVCITLVELYSLYRQPKEKTITDDHQFIQDSFVIHPLKKLWVGIIYFDNNEKKSFRTSKDIYLDINRNQIIIIRHGFFKIIDRENREIDVGSGVEKRYYLKQGLMQAINKKEFKILNNGKDW